MVALMRKKILLLAAAAVAITPVAAQRARYLNPQDVAEAQRDHPELRGKPVAVGGRRHEHRLGGVDTPAPGRAEATALGTRAKPDPLDAAVIAALVAAPKPARVPPMWSPSAVGSALSPGSPVRVRRFISRR